MTAIEPLLNQPVAQAIGWALVHFVWQGTLIAAVTGLLLLALRRSAADVRYVVATIALTLMVTVPAVTAVQAWRTAIEQRAALAAPLGTEGSMPPVARSLSERSALPAVPASTGSAAPAINSGLLVDGVIRRIQVEPWIPGLLFAWLCGVTLLTLRLASGWMWVQRTKSHREALSPTPHLAFDPAPRIGRRRSPDRHRLAEAGRAAADERARRPDAAADGGDSRARARAHPPPRLPREPPAGARRNAAVLPPGGLVALAPHQNRARELL
jgi:hypothetical protein